MGSHIFSENESITFRATSLGQTSIKYKDTFGGGTLTISETIDADAGAFTIFDAEDAGAKAVSFVRGSTVTIELTGATSPALTVAWNDLDI